MSLYDQVLAIKKIKETLATEGVILIGARPMRLRTQTAQINIDSESFSIIETSIVKMLTDLESSLKTRLSKSLE